MKEETKKENNAKKVLDWLYIHRLIIILAGVFLVALIVLTTIYLNLFFDTKGVSFSNDADGNPVYVEDFNSLDEIEYVDISYDFIKHKRITEDASGVYTIEFKLDDIASARISSIKVTALVHSTWVRDYTYISSTSGKTLSLNDTAQTITITYDKALPKMPLLFVFLNHPNLYLKFDVTYTDSGLKTFCIKDTKILGQVPRDGYAVS